MTKNILSVYFGVPGSGKTTVAAALAHKDLKKGKKVWSNVPITGAMKLEATELGIVHVEDGRIIIDEAGIDFNNREFKSFPKTATYYFKYHRHYKVSIDVFSQGWDDMDKKIRTLAQRLYIVRRSLIPFFIVCVPVIKKVSVNEFTKEICDEYKILRLYAFQHKYIYAPKYWKYFNTHSRKQLEEKEFEVY